MSVLRQYSFSLSHAVCGQNIKDPAMLESMMESLDADGDTEVDFQEFMIFIAKLTICCHEFFGHLEDE